jgi:hypothetical protein
MGTTTSVDYIYRLCSNRRTKKYKMSSKSGENEQQALLKRALRRLASRLDQYSNKSNLDTLVLCNYHSLATPKLLNWSMGSRGTFSLF